MAGPWAKASADAATSTGTGSSASPLLTQLLTQLIQYQNERDQRVANGDQQTHPEVVAGVKQSIQAFTQAGKPVGVNAFNLDQARDYLEAGANFVLVGADVQQLGVAARGLVDTFITPLEGK